MYTAYTVNDSGTLTDSISDVWLDELDKIDPVVSIVAIWMIGFTTLIAVTVIGRFIKELIR